MRWPGQKALEERIGELESRSYTDAITAALLNVSTGSTSIKATSTGALEAAAGFVARSFASAEVQAEPMYAAALTPAYLAQIGRALIQYGEMLYMIRTDGGRLRLAPAQSWDVLGDPDPMTWRYRVTLGGASIIETYQDVPADDVIHVRYSFDNREPWRGVAPLTQARLAGRLSAEVSAALTDEASGPRGSFLSVPVDGGDPTVASMKADVPKAKGRMLFAQGGDWDAGATGGRAMWKAERFGANPPAGLVELHKRASMEVYRSLRVERWHCSMKVTAQASVKAYRQALHAT